MKIRFMFSYAQILQPVDLISGEFPTFIITIFQKQAKITFTVLVALQEREKRGLP